jgi:hypothetical protein
LRKRNLDEFDSARSAAVLVDPSHRHQVNDIVERIDRNGLTLKILSAFNRRVFQDFNGVGLVGSSDIGRAAGD